MTRRIRNIAAPLTALALTVLMAPALWAQDPHSVRILTYNTALMYTEATNPASPMPGVPPCPSCHPLDFISVGMACQCDTYSIQVNHHEFADVDEATRAELIANRILATDQEIVILQEVFNPDARAVFVSLLGEQGPYSHYVAELRAPAVIAGLTIEEFLLMYEGIPPMPSALTKYDMVSNDSGLMLFSKYPFLKLEGPKLYHDSSCGQPECAAQGSNNGQPLTDSFFSFARFDHCGSYDCLASKGAGLVKIDTPLFPSYVAFSHMQSDYSGEDYSAVREHQYEVLRDVILGAIPDHEVPNASVYVAGDLNVYAYNREAPQDPDSQEWHDVFNPASSHANLLGGFFACGNGINNGGTIETCRYGFNGKRMLTDSWGFETSTTDDDDGSRLDYILHSTSNRLCMQHSMVAWDLQADPYGNGGLTWLSDHDPRRSDFAPAWMHCSPNDDPLVPDPDRNVRELQFGPTNCTGSGQGPNPQCHQMELVSPPEATIRYGGAMQWFVVDQAGTYSIKIFHQSSSEKVGHAIYHHTDLSRPIEPFEEREGRYGLVYSFPDPPYYIRTFAVDSNGRPDRTVPWREYSLRVFQHLCRSPYEACVLGPADPDYQYLWPTTTTNDPMSELRELWWMFKTSGVRNGRLAAGAGQNIAFPLVQVQMEAGNPEAYKCFTQVEPLLEEYQDPMLPSQLVSQIDFVKTRVDKDDDWDDDSLIDDLRVAPDLEGQVDDQFAIYFLKVTRDSDIFDSWNVCNPSITTYVRYHTDLTYLYPTRVKMWAELDDDIGGEDNIRFHMGFDDSGWTYNPPSSQNAELVFDEPDEESLVGLGKIRGYYVDQVWPNLWEIDEAKLLHAWEPYDPFTGIGTLESYLKATGESFVTLADGPNGDEADYYYHFMFKRCHIADDCAP